jgi:hypothetical protein
MAKVDVMASRRPTNLSCMVVYVIPKSSSFGTRDRAEAESFVVVEEISKVDVFVVGGTWPPGKIVSNVGKRSAHDVG